MGDPELIESGSFASGASYAIHRKGWQFVVTVTHPCGAVTKQRVRQGLSQPRRPAYHAIHRMLSGD